MFRRESMVWRLPVNWVRVTFCKATCTTWTPTICHSTHNNSWHTGSCERADHAIPVISTGLYCMWCNTSICLLYSWGWQWLDSGAMNSIRAYGRNVFHRPSIQKLSTKVCTETIHKKVNNTRTFHHWHGAVGQLQEIPPPPLYVARAVWLQPVAFPAEHQQAFYSISILIVQTFGGGGLCPGKRSVK